MIRALLSVGTVDYLLLEEEPTESSVADAGGAQREAHLGRISQLPYRGASESRGSRVRWAAETATHLGEATPFELWSARLAPQPSASDLDRVFDGHDLVWFADGTAAHLLEHYVSSRSIPTVVDLFDLHEETLEQRLDQLRAEGLTGMLRNARYAAFLRMQLSAWRRWARRVPRRSTCTVVTKQEDCARLGAENVVVVPNGCSVAASAGTRPVGAPPTLLFAGLMTYPPNRDAAHFLAEEINPLLENRLRTDYSIRIVGRGDRDIESLGRYPHVTVVGYVPDMQDELDAADVVVVPLRIGSGTRLKVLEAFANHVPVVSTTVGFSGIE